MYISTIIVLLSSILGLWFCFRHKGVLHKIIAFLFMGAYFCIIINNILILCELYRISRSFAPPATIILFSLLVLFTIIYGFNDKELSLLRKTGVILLGFLYPLTTILFVLDLKYSNFSFLALLIPIYIYIYGIIKDKKGFTKEFGVMILWSGYILNTIYDGLIK